SDGGHQLQAAGLGDFLHGCAPRYRIAIAGHQRGLSEPFEMRRHFAHLPPLFEGPRPADVDGRNIDGRAAEIDPGDGQHATAVAAWLGAFRERSPRQDGDAENGIWKWTDDAMRIGVGQKVELAFPHVRYFVER